MDKAKQVFSRYLNDKQEMVYPDFERMWDNIEPSLPAPNVKLQAVDWHAPKRSRYRKVATLAILAAILAATPVYAAISINWEQFFSHRIGIGSAVQMGLGQVMDESVTQEGIKLTINKAIVDDNRTVILYSLSSAVDSVKDLYFSKMTMKDSQGKLIEGNHYQRWDEATQSMSGYFETEWTPSQQDAEVQFVAQKLQAFEPVEREIDFNPAEGQVGEYTIRQDGIENLKLQAFEQGEKMLFKSAITFQNEEAKAVAYPHIAVFKNGVLLKEASISAFGAPGEHGEYTGQQFYNAEELKSEGIVYKLSYTKESRKFDNEWAYNLHLDKKQMLSGTIKREMNVPMMESGVAMLLKEMVITPTQIRIIAKHERYATFPYIHYAIDMNGTKLEGGSQYNEDDPTETIFRFERPISMEIKEDTIINFIASHLVEEHKDARDPIKLTNISEKKQTMTTRVGNYSVVWTYYKQGNDLYVQSECTDPSFGGVNQTYMGKGAQRLVGKQVTANFSGDGNNKAIDMYANYEGTEAELGIFWYYTEKPYQIKMVQVFPAN